MKLYKIKKTAGASLHQLHNHLSNGGRIVIYGYCVSVIALTLRLTSSPYFIKPGEKLSRYRIGYNIRSLLFGWWGLPWGPVFTIRMIQLNFKNGGGIDVTDDLLLKIKEKYPDVTDKNILSEDLGVEFEESELRRENSRAGVVR